MSDKESTKKEATDNGLAAKVRGLETKVDQLVKYLETMFNFDINKDGKVGRASIALLAIAALALMAGLAMADPIWNLRNSADTADVIAVDASGNLMATGAVTAVGGFVGAVSGGAITPTTVTASGDISGQDVAATGNLSATSNLTVTGTAGITGVLTAYTNAAFNGTPTVRVAGSTNNVVVSPDGYAGPVLIQFGSVTNFDGTPITFSKAFSAAPAVSLCAESELGEGTNLWVTGLTSAGFVAHGQAGVAGGYIAIGLR